MTVSHPFVLHSGLPNLCFAPLRLGLIALVPPLLVIATPWLVHYGLAVADPSEHTFLLHPRLSWTTGQVLESVGLAAGAGILGMALAILHAQGLTSWHLWGVLLLV